MSETMSIALARDLKTVSMFFHFMLAHGIVIQHVT
jgi:hypothetical protein